MLEVAGGSSPGIGLLDAPDIIGLALWRATDDGAAGTQWAFAVPLVVAGLAALIVRSRTGADTATNGELEAAVPGH